MKVAPFSTLIYCSYRAVTSAGSGSGVSVERRWGTVLDAAGMIGLGG